MQSGPLLVSRVAGMAMARGAIAEDLPPDGAAAPAPAAGP